MIKTIIVITAILLYTVQVSAQTSREHIEPGTVKLNGKLGFKSKLAAAVKVLGAITGKDKEPMECGSYFDDEAVPSYLIYINGITLEKHKDEVVLYRIDFRKTPDAYITYPSGRWDRNTTLQQVQKAFPLTAQDEANKEGDSFFIHPGKDSDDFWVLEFKKGRLVSLQYLVQC